VKEAMEDKLLSENVIEIDDMDYYLESNKLPLLVNFLTSSI